MHSNKLRGGGYPRKFEKKFPMHFWTTLVNTLLQVTVRGFLAGIGELPRIQRETFANLTGVERKTFRNRTENFLESYENILGISTILPRESPYFLRQSLFGKPLIWSLQIISHVFMVKSSWDPFAGFFYFNYHEKKPHQRNPSRFFFLYF